MEDKKTHPANHENGECVPEVYGLRKIRRSPANTAILPTVPSTNGVGGAPIVSDSGPNKKKHAIHLATTELPNTSTAVIGGSPIGAKKRKHNLTDDEFRAYKRKKAQEWRDEEKRRKEEKDQEIADLRAENANLKLVQDEKERLKKENEEMKHKLAYYEKLAANHNIGDKINLLLSKSDAIMSMVIEKGQDNASHSQSTAANDHLNMTSALPAVQSEVNMTDNAKDLLATACNDHMNMTPTLPAVQSEGNNPYSPSDLPDDLASLSINDLPISRGEAIRLMEIAVESMGNKEEFRRRIGDEDHQ